MGIVPKLFTQNYHPLRVLKLEKDGVILPRGTKFTQNYHPLRVLKLVLIAYNGKWYPYSPKTITRLGY